MRRSIALRAAYLLSLLVCACVLRADDAQDQFNFATGLLIKNEPRLAADEFKILLEKYPQYPQADVAAYRLGESLQKAGDAAAARAAFELVLQKYPRSERVVSAHYMLAQMLAAKEPKAAADHYAAVAGVAGQPLAEPAAFGRGEALYQAADWKTAAEAYAQVLAQYPAGKYAAQSLYSRGWSLFQAADYDGASQAFLAFVQKYPTNELSAECRLKAGDSLRRARRYDEAIQAYAPLCAAGNARAPDALAGKAWTLYERGDFAAALPAFREAAKGFGQDARGAVYLFNAGNAAIETRQFPVAAELFGQVQTGWPTNDLARPAMYWQALAMLRQGQADVAAAKLEGLRQAVVPKDLAAETVVLLAEAQFARKRYAEAATLYASVAKDFPGHALGETAAAAGVLALEKQGDLPAAETAAAAFAAHYPHSGQQASMQFLVGEYRYRQGRYAEAAPALEAFAAANPTNDLAAAALLKAAWSHWHLKQVARAGELFGTVAAQYAASPLAADAAFMAGRAAEEQGGAAAAAAAYADAVKLGGDNDAAQRAGVELIRLDRNARHADAALARADAFIAAHPASAVLPRARLNRAEALLELNRPAEALDAYRQVGESDPVAAASAADGAAWALRKLGRHAEAAEAFAKVALGTASSAADARFWVARSLEDAGRLEDAAAGYAACLAQTPANPHADEAAYRQAYCAWQGKKPDEAQRLYAAVIATRTGSPFAASALYDLAWVQFEQGRKDDARQRFEAFVQQNPTNPLACDARFRIGELAYDKEQFAAAATNYEAVVAGDVTFKDKALYKLGWARERLQEFEAARQAFQRLAREFPKSELAPEAQYRSGRLLQAMGKLDDACSALVAVTNGPFAEKAAFNAAECLRANNKPADALSAYDRVLVQWTQGECRVQALLGRGHALRALTRLDDAIAAYGETIKATETIEAAQALLGQGYCWFAQHKWDEAAKAFLKVDILYGYETLKPEALSMAAQTWQEAGDAAKAASYRAELKTRFPASKEALAIP